MPRVRRVTYTWDSLRRFLEDHERQLAAGALWLPPGTVEGELAPEIRLDLVIPLLGRVGPIRAQVVQRAPDGGVGLLLPEFEEDAGRPVRRLLAAVDEIRQWLLDRGELAAPRPGGPPPAPPQAPAAATAPVAEEAEAPAAAPPVEPAPKGARAARPRGLALPDLSGLAPALQGSMGDRSFRDAIVELAVEKLTGVLRIEDPEGRVRTGYWLKGGPVGWRSDPLREDEVLGVLLYRAGQLTKEQVAESLRIMEAQGVRQGEALLDMGVLSFPQLVAVLGKQVEYVLQRVLREERSGRWAFYVLDALPERFLPPPLKVPSLLFRQLVRRAEDMPAADLAEALRPYVDRYVFVAEDAAAAIEEIRYRPGERKFLEVTRSSSWRLRELFAMSPLTRRKTAAVVWALTELGFLRYEQKEDRQRYLGRVGHRIRRKKAQAAKGTYFDALEVHWICLPREVDEAYRRLKEEFDPARYEDLPADLAEDLAFVNDKLDEAHEVLGHDARRREYRKRVVEDFMILQSAELLARKGEMAIMRQDRAEATTCFAKALELVPGRPEYRDGLQRAMAVGRA